MLDLNPQFPTSQNKKSNHHSFNNHSNYRHRFNGGGNVQFRLETSEEEDSGVCSPPLWQNNNQFSPPDSPGGFPNTRALSPASRALAIARGKKEMMEMVENMPETSYELSLKDMVDHRRQFVDHNETQSMEDGEEQSILRGGQTESKRWKKNKKGSVKRQESNKQGRVIVKNTSMNHKNGFLINMFFPFSMGSKKKSSITTSISFGNNNNNVKSSPKPEPLLDKSWGGDRTDWWWKRFTGSGDSESLGITSSSSRSRSSGSSGSSGHGSLRSNSGSNKNDCGYGCWSFFKPTRRKS